MLPLVFLPPDSDRALRWLADDVGNHRHRLNGKLARLFALNVKKRPVFLKFGAKREADAITCTPPGISEQRE